MKLRYRLVFLFIFLITLIWIGYAVTKNFSFITNDFWFASGLLLLILGSLIDQPFFSTDANIFMNGTAGISLILVEPSGRDFWWFCFLGWCIWLIISSFSLMVLNSYKPEFKSPVKDLISRINREIGRPESLYSAFFIWGAIRQFGLNSSEIEPLFIFWVVFFLINIPSMARAINKFLEDIFHKKVINPEIGSLYRVEFPRVVEIKLRKDCPDQIVGKSIDLSTSAGEQVATAVVIDDRVMAGNRIAKIATTAITSHWNYVAQQPEKMGFSITGNRFLGPNEEVPISVVDIGSTIGNIIFYIHPDFPLRKGEVVWTYTSDQKRVYYQVTKANIIEKHEIEENSSLSVQVTANQLGIWDEKEIKFDQYPWVPPAGYLVYRVIQKENHGIIIPKGKVEIGGVPNSNFPILANIDDLVTHNTAIIGITGSGKSYLSFHLIASLLSKKIKVLVLDLTREYFSYLQKFKPTAIRGSDEIKGWFESDSLLGIYQFANSQNYPSSTKEFVCTAFDQIKNVNLGPGVTINARLCIVFEEAHALIPEFSQVAQKSDTDFVNATSRTILQGRKYGMGSIVITQRTANVTKTILNQCNTMIALRAFDQTGLDFLSNYMGQEYAHAISTLPSRYAIMVGKASSCQTPVIFKIPTFEYKIENYEKEKENGIGRECQDHCVNGVNLNKITAVQIG